MKKKFLVQVVSSVLFSSMLAYSFYEKHSGMDYEFRVINSGNSSKIRKVYGLEDSDSYQVFSRNGKVRGVKLIRDGGSKLIDYIDLDGDGDIDQRVSIVIPKRLRVCRVREEK